MMSDPTSAGEWRLAAKRNVRSVVTAVCIALSAIFTVYAPAQSTPEMAAAAAQALHGGNYAKAEGLYSELAKMMPEVAEVHSNLGLARYYQKKFAAAEQDFRAALRLKPELFVPNFFLAEVYLKSEKYAEAVPFLRKAVKAQPQEGAALRALADDLLALGRETEAVAQYKKLVDQNPRDEDALYRLARTYLVLGQQAARSLNDSRHKAYAAVVIAEFSGSRPGWETVAIGEYRNAIAASPQIPGLRVALANLLFRTAKWQTAEQVLREELSIDPRSYEARVELAELALHQGKLDPAVTSIDEAARIRPEFFDPLPHFELTLSAEQRSEYYSALTAKPERVSFGAAWLARQVADRGNPAHHATSWQSAAEAKRDVLIQDLKRREQGIPRAFRSYDERRALGLMYIADKRFEIGVGLLMPVAGRWQSDPEVKVAVARALFKLERFEELTQLLKGSHASDAESLYFLAVGYRQLGIQAMEKLVEVNAQSAELQSFLGETFTSLKMFKEAKTQYESAITMHPLDPGLYFGLGDVYYDQMQFNLAADAYARAIQMDPSDARSYIMRGEALVRLHRAAEAIPLAREAMRLDSKSPDAHIMLGRALEQLGQDREAIRELEQAASTDTDGSLHYVLFNLYRKVGEKESAEQALLASDRLKERAQRKSAGKARLEGSLFGFQQ